MKFESQFVYVNRIPYLVGMAVLSTSALYPGLKGRISYIETGLDSSLYPCGAAIHCTLEPPQTLDAVHRLEKLHSEFFGVPQFLDDITFADVALGADEIRVIVDHMVAA